MDVIREKGTFVRIRYSVRTDEGEYVKGDPAEGLAFLEIYTGYNQLLPGLERRLLGRKAGDRLQIRIPPEEAFGPYRPERVRRKSYEEFPEGRTLQEGRWVEARDEKTRAAYGYFVVKKDEVGVVLDFNHPLAGKALNYDLEIEEARPATEEERVLLRPCEGDPEADGP